MTGAWGVRNVGGVKLNYYGSRTRLNDFPKWIDLNSLKWATSADMDTLEPTVIFKDKNEHLLRVKIKTEFKEIKGELVESITANISVSKKGSNKFVPVVFTKSAKNKLLDAVFPLLPDDNPDKFSKFLDFFGDLEVAPTK